MASKSFSCGVEEAVEIVFFLYMHWLDTLIESDEEQHGVIMKPAI